MKEKKTHRVWKTQLRALSADFLGRELFWRAGMAIQMDRNWDKSYCERRGVGFSRWERPSSHSFADWYVLKATGHNLAEVFCRNNMKTPWRNTLPGQNIVFLKNCRTLACSLRLASSELPPQWMHHTLSSEHVIRRHAQGGVWFCALAHDIHHGSIVEWDCLSQHGSNPDLVSQNVQFPWTTADRKWTCLSCKMHSQIVLLWGLDGLVWRVLEKVSEVVQGCHLLIQEWQFWWGGVGKQIEDPLC